jgi:hypothetical protein
MKKGSRVINPFRTLLDGSIAVVVHTNKDRMYLLTAGKAPARMVEFFRQGDDAPKTATALVIGNDSSGGYSILAADLFGPGKVSATGGVLPEIELETDPFGALEQADFNSTVPIVGDTVFARYRSRSYSRTNY